MDAPGWRIAPGGSPPLLPSLSIFPPQGLWRRFECFASHPGILVGWYMTALPNCKITNPFARSQTHPQDRKFTTGLVKLKTNHNSRMAIKDHPIMPIKHRFKMVTFPPPLFLFFFFLFLSPFPFLFLFHRNIPIWRKSPKPVFPSQFWIYSQRKENQRIVWIKPPLTIPQPTHPV